MKKISIVIALLSVIVIFGSCNRKTEILNREADILKVILPADVLKRNPIIANKEITCYVKADVDLTKIAPTFELSPGATINPASGTVLDFTSPQIYTVTSEDGEWQKKYTVTLITAELLDVYHFDNFEIGGDVTHKFHILYEMSNGVKSTVWASGNPGFSILAGDKPASEYPTFMADEGYKNHSAKLTTQSGGPMGATYKAPIASGSLFLGVFKINIDNPLKSTRMGVPFTHKPMSLKGYYKYKSGQKYIQYTDANGNYIDEGVEINRKDSCDIYAVFYEVTPNLEYLDGTNVLNHDNIVSIARIDNAKEQNDWTAFEIPFVMKPGKTINQDKLKNGDYNITIVFTSSKDGAIFNGSVGSTLYVDEVRLISE